MGEKYEKLVRDGIPEMLDSKGVRYERRVANPEEYKQELIKKLAEEIAEFQETGDPEELADVIEVVEALKRIPKYANVEELRVRKLIERGGFDKRLIVKGEKDE